MLKRLTVALACGLCLCLPGAASASPPPDARFKADILLVLGHPDDETLVSGFLARCALERHKRVAVVYGTHGEGGGNGVGFEQAGALSAVREIEVRRALTAWGIDNVWFLGGRDTASQNVLRSLETWHHGEALADLVRLVRLTRPQVILTMLPVYSAGENHGDHQAAGVLATEAFDVAGDPTAFAEQVTPPSNPTGIGSLTEGLRPWQPQKLYYFSDTSHPEALDGHGPAYPTSEISPSRGVPYYKVSAEEWKFHQTQDDVTGIATKAQATGDWKAMLAPERLVLGKSLVGGTPAEDVFAHGTDSIGYVAAPGYRSGSAPALQLGGPWGFYRDFWRAHALLGLDTLWTPEAEIGFDRLLHVPVLVRNDSPQAAQIPLRLNLPPGWRADPAAPAALAVPPHDVQSLDLLLRSPAGTEPAWQTLSVEATGERISLRVHLVRPEGLLPQESGIRR